MKRNGVTCIDSRNVLGDVDRILHLFPLYDRNVYSAMCSLLICLRAVCGNVQYGIVADHLHFQMVHS